MFTEPPLDPPDEGTPHDSQWDCPQCDSITDCVEWVEVHGRYEATITTQCLVCNYTKEDHDYSYGYDG